MTELPLPALHMQIVTIHQVEINMQNGCRFQFVSFQVEQIESLRESNCTQELSWAFSRLHYCKGTNPNSAKTAALSGLIILWGERNNLHRNLFGDRQLVPNRAGLRQTISRRFPSFRKYAEQKAQKPARD
jgi:hypothetical protein